MQFGKFIRTIAPLAAVAAMGLAVSACDGHVTINGDEGKKLSELDLGGEAPHKLALFGPDTVKVSQGDKLAITVDGDAASADKLRFSLKNGTLAILRSKDWKDGPSVTVNVTMPAPSEIAQMGSGKIEAGALDKDAKVNLMGSGDVNASAIAGHSLELKVMGSGTMHGAGTVKKLDLTVMGSGSADLAGMKTESADIDILGSGSAAFASDGEVKAKIMGSGSVTVKGRAKCTVKSVGSGSLVCESGPATKMDGDDEAEPKAEPSKS
jgi:hypothetical protein